MVNTRDSLMVRITNNNNNMNTTYKELLTALQELTPEQLNMNVTIYDSRGDEFYPAHALKVTTYIDVLDNNHPYIPF